MNSAWNNNLLSLPDSIFFDIMRNYLGDLKTPFNKHDLIRSLTSFIMRKDVKQRLFAMIDAEDSLLLTAIELMKSAGLEELYEFLKHRFSFLELHNRIANLQERLLIWVEYPAEAPGKGRKQIMLNPVFAEELKEGYLNTGLLFRNEPDPAGFPAPWLNEQLIAAFISFAAANRGVFSRGSTGRKKAESRFDTVFRSMPEDAGSGIITFMTEICSVLGFISGGEEDLELRAERISAFAGRPGPERRVLTAAAAVVSFPGVGEISIEPISEMLAGLFGNFESGTRLHRRDLRSFFYLARRNISTAADMNISDKLLTEALCYAGYLIKDGDFRTLNFRTVDSGNELLRIQSNFEINAPAGFPIGSEFTAAACCEIRQCDVTRTYELTKESFSFALDSGLTADEIVQQLENASGGALPQNIAFSIRAWEKEYRSISLNYGIVMTVEKSRLPLIAHNPGLKEFITAEPAPGVFILDPAREHEWRRAFINAGFDLLPRTAPVSDSRGYTRRQVKLNVTSRFPEYHAGSRDASAETLIEELSSRIRKLSVPQEDRLQIEARARKKLILNDSQLAASSRPAERGEAGGLDHRAKIRLAERALDTENLLEITTARELELEKRLVKPLRIEKIESEDPDKPPLFRIIGIELPDENEYQIPITRVSHLKMLKSSLFTP